MFFAELFTRKDAPMKTDAPYDANSLEGTTELRLDFKKLLAGESRVLPVAVQDAKTGEVILIAYTNEAAFKKTLSEKKAVFWSTSRNELWYKGDGSGNTFTVHEILVNCEQNSMVYKVTPDKGNICHVKSGGVALNCYYRALDINTMKLKMTMEESL